jgi:hypothetical protein
MKLLAIVLVFSSCLMLPELEASMAGELPDTCDDACVIILMNQAYNQGHKDAASYCTLPNGPRVPRIKKDTSI